MSDMNGFPKMVLTKKRSVESDVVRNINDSPPQVKLQLKRFKNEKTDVENIYQLRNIKAGRLSQQASKINSLSMLSPITEMAINLTETINLNDDGISTPKSTLMAECRHVSHDQKISTIAASAKKRSFQLPRNPATIISGRRLNMDSPPTLDEMAVDELTYYRNETVIESDLRDPHLCGLLSPEGSPRRFDVIDKSKNINKFQLTEKCQQMLHNANETSTESSNMSGKGLQLFHSLSNGSMESSMDDEYMELFQMESLEEQSGQINLEFPTGLTSLIQGQIKNQSPVNYNKIISTPEIRRPSVRRCLSMTENSQPTPKTPQLLKKLQGDAINVTPYSSHCLVEQDDNANDVINYCFKRPDPPSSNTSPVQVKRIRSEEKENQANNMIVIKNQLKTLSTCRPPVRKSMSMNDAEIMSALARSECKDEPDLIGDFSKPFVLPLMEGRHRDLKSISSDTVARLLKGEFDHLVGSYQIIDCRYPYEYEGGHIRGAKNLYTQEQIMEEFLTQEKTEKLQTSYDGISSKRNIIIFHCEFSSERGPKLSRFLRNNDRARNTNSYPALDYPEIYLLHNGYKEFYETHAEFCDPNAYRPMLEPSYNEAYRHFRAKSKSWNGDGLGGATGRLKKSRSRLIL